MTIETCYLADCPEAVTILAQWLYDEWGRHSPDGSIRSMAENLMERMNRDSFPLALVAMQDGRPLGTVSLKIREMEIRPQYEHWLGTVYVHEPYRRKGIGSQLIEAAVKEANRLGVKELYLYTRSEQTEALYAKLGWATLERPFYRGRRAVIMKRVRAAFYEGSAVKPR